MINAVTSNIYTAAVSNAQTGMSSPRMNTTSAGGVSAETDTVTISKAGMRSMLLSKFQPFPNTLDAMAEELSRDTAFVENEIQSLYRKIGLSPNTEMKFSVGYDGHILVDGNNAEAEALAKAINEDDELANSIRKIGANASLLDAAKKYQEFAAAYKKDPVAAVDRYGYLLEDGHEYHVTFSVRNGHIDTTVEFV
ncbi:MAG: hypothetical protein ABIF87_10315 [Pseudomonadota bacterium]